MRFGLIFTVSVAVLSGCTCVDTVMTQTGSSDGSVRGDGGVVAGGKDGGGVSSVDAGLSAFDIVSLEVTPALVSLTPSVGQRVTQQFTAQGVRRDGSKTSPSSIEWGQDTLVAGDLDPTTGVFTTNGLTGAQVKISATLIVNGSPVVGNATVNVKITSVAFGATTMTSAPSLFTAVQAVGAESANIGYPLDNAVMPQNVYPVDVQWLNGVMDDVFRVTLSKSSVSITSYQLHSGNGFNNHWQVDQASWRALAQSSPDEAAVLTVDRWVKATGIAIASKPIHLKFAKAALSGSIYYWGINDARVYRIDDGTNAKVNFLPTPPVQNEENGTSQCVGCHSVSPSGRYMASRMGGGFNYGTVFDLTSDLTADPPPSLFATQKVRWWFSTWNPDETRLLVSTGGPTRLMLLDPHTGEEVAAGGAGLPSNDQPAHPAWSPDGKSIAYTRILNSGDWGVDYRDSNLNVLAVTGPDTFGPPSSILRGEDVPGRQTEQRAISYPGWTPDSKRLIFSLGFSARSAPNANENHMGQLFMVNKDGTNVVPLNKLNNGERLAYEPRFSPFDSGGYYWVAFLSRRDYGNAEVGSKGSQVAQIWISAIKKNPAPGEDPSEVGYWMTGQNPKSASISAYWAARACRATGISCGVASECCSGDCRPPAAGGASVCSPPPAERCRIEGQTCGGGGECCTGLTCDQSVCRTPIL